MQALEDISLKEIYRLALDRDDFSKDQIKTWIGERTWQREEYSLNPHVMVIKNVVHVLSEQIK